MPIDDNRWQSIITPTWMIDCPSIININRLIGIDCHRLSSIAIDYRFHRFVTSWVIPVLTHHFRFCFPFLQRLSPQWCCCMPSLNRRILRHKVKRYFSTCSVFSSPLAYGIEVRTPSITWQWNGSHIFTKRLETSQPGSRVLNIFVCFRAWSFRGMTNITKCESSRVLHIPQPSWKLSCRLDSQLAPCLP